MQASLAGRDVETATSPAGYRYIYHRHGSRSTGTVSLGPYGASRGARLALFTLWEKTAGKGLKEGCGLWGGDTHTLQVCLTCLVRCERIRLQRFQPTPLYIESMEALGPLQRAAIVAPSLRSTTRRHRPPTSTSQPVSNLPAHNPTTRLSVHVKHCRSVPASADAPSPKCCTRERS